MNIKKTTLTVLISLLFMGCSTQSYNRFQSDNTIKTVSNKSHQSELLYEWKVSKNDRIEVIVFNQSSVGGKQLDQLLSNAGSNVQYTDRDGTEGILIGNSGSVSMPLIGEVRIMGLTEDQAAKKLTNEYRKYLRNPFVKVKILNQKLFVLGEVRKPGVVQITHGTMTVFEALARSGDLTVDAKRTNLKIIRGDLRSPEVREIDLTDMSAIALSSMILRPNDVLFIQARDMKAYNIAFNEQKPFFELITQMLLPFVSISIIKDGATFNGF